MRKKVKKKPNNSAIVINALRRALRMESDFQDELLRDLIDRSVAIGENYTGRSFITQTHIVYYDNREIFTKNNRSQQNCDGLSSYAQNFGVRDDSILELPVAPIQSITEIETYGQDSTPTIIDSGSYYLDNYSDDDYARIVFSDGLPSIDRIENSMSIEYISGYGNSENDLPVGLIGAIVNLCVYMFSNDGCPDYEVMKNSNGMHLFKPYKIKQV